MHNLIKNIGIILFRFEKHFDPEFPHYRFYTVKSLQNILCKGGFNILKIKYIGRFRPISNNMLFIAQKNVNRRFHSQYHY